MASSSMDLHTFRIFFFFIFLFLVVPKTALAADYLSEVYHNCLRNTTTGTLSSTFKHNLNSALSNLTTLSSKGTKYAINTTGSGDDMVYAMFQCRGDQTLQMCWDCVANATVLLPETDCPAYIGARLQLDGCYLRYDNQSFFTPDFSYVGGLCNTRNTTDSVFLKNIETVMENVTTLAPQQHGFASASLNGAEYALAQCLGYLNETECAQCLTTVSYRTVCDATLGEQVHLASCYYRYETYSFFEAPSPPPPGLAPAASPPPPPPGRPAATVPPMVPPTHRDYKAPIIGGIASGAILTIVALCIAMWLYKANKTKGESRVKREQNGGSWSRSFFQNHAKVFLLQELEAATGHFHPNNKLGEGGFGPVYKGTLSNGDAVAIKKLAIGSRQGKQEFLNEVNLITSLQHKNLIRLQGCCVDGVERILVYEYVPNKSLDSLLFEPRDDKTLSWSTRFGIVLGMAKGLSYLHEESHIRIIHRDIKPSNILLDDQLNPIIGDFGLARLVGEDESHINTRVAGTTGYLAPEYALHGELSEKADVYSFGVVSLEIITGKRNLTSKLLSWVWQMYLQNKVLELVDSKLGDDVSPEQVIRVIHVALLCTQEYPKQRPTMSTVTLWLLGQSQILYLPIRPPFVDLSELREPIDATNSQQNSTSSTYSTQYSHASRNLGSYTSGGAQSISEFDPR